MRIRSDKSLLFRGDTENIIIRKSEIKDVPDWVAKTDTFKLANKEGSILVIETKEQKIKAENEDKIEETKIKKNKSKESSL
ncbi:hypothetical protein DP145_01730 [Clostridium tetani]|uniref:hypothetical protein n=1 Tax=Clostridium tetani TaxID=1513 RepID=UPI00100AB8C7|nr:hypothetical protein [Clostridium tetani]RXI46084.1 hypothetical protein DP126_07810 [Clostridium tetani]RXM61476.1 hypothetical protein DP138_04645 [Clostridium tetani]RXM70301.1 hypothetical protein DP145_01730 [Clostridium tetani]